MGESTNSTGRRPLMSDIAARPRRVFNDIAAPVRTTPPAKPTPQPTLQAQQVTPTPNSAQASHTSSALHNQLHKSATLHRKAVRKPQPAPKNTARSPLISRFAPGLVRQGVDLQPVSHSRKEEEIIRPPTQHPTVVNAIRRPALPPSHGNLSGSQLKEQLIKERLAEIQDKPHKDHKRRLLKRPRTATLLTASLALLILGGYLTYMTLPSISMQVAASRAGVNASMPSYKPDGYSLDGPIVYSPGEVVVKYRANAGAVSYQLSEKASNWDSQALLDNYVTKNTNNYLTFQERGLTIYTFGDKAAWVSGGLLYTISGDARLSSEQILRIASSI